MKKWFVIDDRTTARAAMFEDVLKAKTKDAAIAEARAQWERLTEAERREADDFYIGFAEEIEDGVVDYDSMTDIYSFKREEME